jgi:hypothetical protein
VPLLLFFFFFYGSPTGRSPVRMVRPHLRAPHHGSRVEEGELQLAGHGHVVSWPHDWCRDYSLSGQRCLLRDIFCQYHLSLLAGRQVSM